MYLFDLDHFVAAHKEVDEQFSGHERKGKHGQLPPLPFTLRLDSSNEAEQPHDHAHLCIDARTHGEARVFSAWLHVACALAAHGCSRCRRVSSTLYGVCPLPLVEMAPVLLSHGQRAISALQMAANGQAGAGPAAACETNAFSTLLLAGNVARFLNSSCASNLVIQVVLLPRESALSYHISFFAEDDIPAFTELTYDYGRNYKVDGRDMDCLCGAATCRSKVAAEAAAQPNMALSGALLPEASAGLMEVQDLTP